MKSIINKKSGWIKIVESFTAILLITGFLLIVFSREDIQNQEVSQKVHDAEQKILLEIQLNDSLRNEILGYNSESFPIGMVSLSDGLQGLITSKAPGYLECEGKVCAIQGNCGLGTNTSRDVYVQKVLISANTDTYNPREFNLFCWMK